MDRDELSRLATESIEAFNRADWDGLTALMAADLVYEETGTGRRVEGRDAVLAVLRAWREGVPDATGEVARMLVDEAEGTTALEILWRGAHSGPLATPGGVVPASGASFEMWATLWQRWSDGVLVHEHHHLDILSMMLQLGALPAPAGV